MSYTTSDIEILIATMNRKSPDFLVAMFPFHNLEDLNVLIINQTTDDELLVSDISSVRVVNSFEKGLSKSRNLALENANGTLCVIADDDVVFEEGFENEVIKAFNEYKDAAAITFCYRRLNSGAELPEVYPKENMQHTPASLRRVSSIEMVVNRQIILQKNVIFNINFGLGAEFETGEEFLFLRKLMRLGGKIWYYPSVIVAHEAMSSGLDHASERLVYARSALAYKLYGGWAGLWLFKYMQFLLRKRMIAVTQLPDSFITGFKGIRRYKRLLNEGKEIKNA